MTEREIQNILFGWVTNKGHQLVVPNCGVNGWEADLLSVTAANFLNEYEIKTNKKDYNADFKKSKHRYLKSETKGRRQWSRPNCFWFVLDFVGARDIVVPDYAGLITIDHDLLRPVVRKPAPKIHVEPIGERTREYLERGLMYRYWKARIRRKRTQ